MLSVKVNVMAQKVMEVYCFCYVFRSIVCAGSHFKTISFSHSKFIQFLTSHLPLERLYWSIENQRVLSQL